MYKCFLNYTLIMLVALLFFVSGCSVPTPPELSAVEQRFENNYSDLQTIVNFLIDNEYTQDIYISSSNGTMLVGTETVQISDETVNNAVKQLISNKLYFTFSRNGNTIKILQWRGSMDVGAGIAYSINENEQPEIQFMTELMPLSKQGWFYYISDYNEWRLNRTSSVTH